MKCRHDNSEIPVFHSFGLQPIANGFLNENNPKDEYFFQMDIAVNLKNGLLQLVEQPDPSQMFHENYAFFSRTSNFMKQHFKEVAEEIISLTKSTSNDDEKFVIEIGSNDGVMLEHIVSNGIPCLGVEPSKNVALESNKYGVETISEFFSTQLAKNIKSSKGKADVIYAANVFCHIPDINDLGEACSTLLKKGGMLVFEDPYLVDVLEKVSYDQIYDEHVYLFSCSSIADVFKQYDLHLFDCKPLRTHGGSMRYYLTKEIIKEQSPNLEKALEKENFINLRDHNTFLDFAKKCEFSRVAFKDHLFNAKKECQRIIGYGATSKSTTILNYCDIGPDLIDFFIDTTPGKQNKYTPGKHIPIYSYEKFIPHPDLAVLFAWNHKEEIMLKESNFSGEWITHLYEEYI